MFAHPLRNPHTWLVLYLVILAAIAFWPTHVDERMGPFLRWVTRAISWLTYDRIEFAANIALFVPFGVLLMLILNHRYLVLPIALVATVGIETVQSFMGGRRTPSFTDVVANTAGACVGMLIVALVQWLRGRRAERDALTHHAAE